MLTSPITITLAGTAHSLSRVNQDNFSSTYRKAWVTGGDKYELVANIRHSYQGKAGVGQLERHNVELIYRITNGVTKDTIQYTAYSVIATPRIADPVGGSDLVTALNAFVTTNAAVLVAWES